MKHWEKNESENHWKVCHDNNITIRMTVYPVGIDIENIETLANKNDVKLELLTDVGDRDYKGIKKSVHHPFDLGGNAKPYEFICCYQLMKSMF